MARSGPYFAHSLPAPFREAEWEELGVHHDGVAARAVAFGAGAWGRLAGAWHDLGKLQSDFQRYVRGLSADERAW